jgi:hypothetical protein
MNRALAAPRRDLPLAAMVAVSTALTVGGPAPATASPAEVAVVIAVDTSRSLRPIDLERALDALGRELGELPADTPAALLAFDDTPRWVLPLGTPLGQVPPAMARLPLQGNFTLLNDALFVAARELAEGGVIVLVTDGLDDGSATTVEDVAALADRQGVRIVALGTGPRIDERALRRLALLTEGAYLGAAGRGALAAEIGVAAAVAGARQAVATARRQQAAELPGAVAPAILPRAEDAALPVASAPAQEPGRRWPPSWPWLLVPLGALVIVGAAAAARRRARRPRPHYCLQCGSDLAARGAECSHCQEVAAQERLGRAPVAGLGDTAEMALPGELLTSGTAPGVLEKTRVLVDRSVLLVREPGQPQRSYLLRPDLAFGVGRDAAGNTLALADPALSAHHLKFVPEEGAFWVVDLGSTNGTLVNDQRVKARRLRSGDRILAGQVELELHSYVTAAG